MKSDPTGAEVAILAGDLGDPRRLAIDDTHVYWVDHGSNADGAVWRVERDGGDPELLALQQSLPSGIVLDDEAIYWTNGGDSGSVATRSK